MSDLWTVWIEHDEPEYPEGIQRTGRRRVMIVSAVPRGEGLPGAWLYAVSGELFEEVE